MINNKVLIIKKGCINELSSIFKDYEINGKILFVSDTIVDKLYGDIVRRQIQMVGIIRQELIDNNTISYAMNLAERVIATDIDCIVALGGGKVLDVCKYSAYISKKTLISIPTTVANDGIASPIAVLKRQDNKPKSLGCTIPTILLIDTEIVYSSPIELIKAGIGDTISNYMALLDWEYAVSKGKDRMNGYAYMMSKNSLDALLKTQYNKISLEFVEVLINSLVLSGIAMEFCGTSRPVSGAEHLFSHALDYYGKKQNLHGLQVALGTIAVLKIINHDYSVLLDYLKRFDVNVNPNYLNIDKKTFILCMKNATSMRKNRYTYLNDVELNDDKLSIIYDELVKEL